MGLLARGDDHDACVNRSCHARREIVNWESDSYPTESDLQRFFTNNCSESEYVLINISDNIFFIVV